MKVPKYVSVTDVCSFSFCPRQVYFSKVLGFRSPVSRAMFVGSMKHRAFEVLSSVEEKLMLELDEGVSKESFVADFESLASSGLRSVFGKSEGTFSFFDLDLDEVFKSAYSLISSEVSSRSSLIYDFANSEGVFGGELRDRFFPKVLSEKRFSSDRLRLRGNVDRVVVYEDCLVPFDFKSGRLPVSGVFDSHRLQMGAYCMILDDNFDLPVREGFVTYVDFGVSRKVVVNDFLVDKVLEGVEGVFGLFGLDEPPSCSGKVFCSCKAFEQNL